MIQNMNANDEAELTRICAAVAKICDVAPIDPKFLAKGADKKKRKSEIEQLKSAATIAAERWRNERTLQ